MNAQSKRPLIIVVVVFLSLGVLGALGYSLGRVVRTMSPGQTRFVAVDRFQEIRGYQMYKRGQYYNWERVYSPGATPEDCGSEPTVESMVHGTKFYVLIVPSRDLIPREKLQKTLTRDGQVVAFQNLEGADIMEGKHETCFVDSGLFGSTGTGAQDDEDVKWPGGALPVGRYHFELMSGTEVLSSGDITITQP